MSTMIEIRRPDTGYTGQHGDEYGLKAIEVVSDTSTHQVVLKLHPNQSQRPVFALPLPMPAAHQLHRAVKAAMKSCLRNQPIPTPEGE